MEFFFLFEAAVEFTDIMLLPLDTTLSIFLEFAVEFLFPALLKPLLKAALVFRDIILPRLFPVELIDTARSNTFRVYRAAITNS